MSPPFQVYEAYDDYDEPDDDRMDFDSLARLVGLPASGKENIAPRNANVIGTGSPVRRSTPRRPSPRRSSLRSKKSRKKKSPKKKSPKKSPKMARKLRFI